MSETNERFALTNPITLITGKKKEDFTREDMIQVIIEKNIERITFHYTSIDGKVKELKIPIANKAQAESILSQGERVDGSSLFKGMVDTGKSDLYVVPVYSTAFLNPFDPHSLDFVCRFFDKEGNPAEHVPDNILAKAANMLKATSGYELYALGELEFYLIGDRESGNYPVPAQKGYHCSAPFCKTGDIINEILRHLTVISGNIKYAHNEVGNITRIESDFEELDGKFAEQVEIEFLPAPVMEMADTLVLATWIIRNVAYEYGFIATFFPKLEIGHAGSGMHIHMALMKDGKNAMTTGGKLSEDALALIGGLCTYAPSLTAFGNMVSASYLRLVPGQEAPTRVCWSEMNRSALIRVPLAWNNLDNLAHKVNPQQKTKVENIDCKQTVELRSPDGSANCHLLLAGITMAAEWGIRNKELALDVAKSSHVSVNIHSSASEEDLKELATSCVESSERLLQHRDLYERENIFPSNVINFISSLLNNESDRNLNNRLMALDDEERVFQSRRIMHRDIHKH